MREPLKPAAAAYGIKPGDRVRMSVPVYRKWWQVWKPRIVRREPRIFTVTTVSEPIYSEPLA